MLYYGYRSSLKGQLDTNLLIPFYVRNVWPFVRVSIILLDVAVETCGFPGAKHNVRSRVIGGVRSVLLFGLYQRRGARFDTSVFPSIRLIVIIRRIHILVVWPHWWLLFDENALPVDLDSDPTPHLLTSLSRTCRL